MSRYKAILLGSVALSLISLQAAPENDGRDFSNVLKTRLAKHQRVDDLKYATRVAEEQEQKPANDAAAAAPATSTAGVTEYHGVSDAIATPPWAAEAKVYLSVDDGSAAPSPAEKPAAAPAPAAAADAPASAAGEVVHGVTSYNGDTARAEEQPFSAPATVFEQVTVSEPAPAAPEPAAPAAAAEPAPAAAAVEAPKVNYVESHPADPVPGVTWYPGETRRAEDQPYSAPAKMMVMDEPAPAAAAPKVNYVESRPAPPVPGVTWYPGETKRAEDQAFSVPAKMMMEAPSAAANSCRDELNVIVLAGRILFDNNSWDIRPESFKTLDKLAVAAKSCGGVVIEVGGHTDNTGTIAANEEISKLRAESVSKYLAKAGVDAAKLKAAGFGQSKPVADNTTPEGRQKNRRIEFAVSGG